MKVIQLVDHTINKGMSSGHEAQLYKLEENSGEKMDKCVAYYK